MWFLFVYYFVGAIFYTSVVEDWEFTQTMHFMTVTLLTVGYGDHTPTSQSSRCFTIFYILCGISVAAAAIVQISEILVQMVKTLLDDDGRFILLGGCFFVYHHVSAIVLRQMTASGKAQGIRRKNDEAGWRQAHRWHIRSKFVAPHPHSLLRQQQQP